MKVEIDANAGFCFGVKKAVELAEQELRNANKLYCIGEFVHNKEEVQRLKELGLQTIKKEDLSTLRNSTVLIRAHGEPPETYQIAKSNNIKVIEASCPIVLKLQEKVSRAYQKMLTKNGQIVIAGRRNHPEIIGLNGVTNYSAIIIESEKDISKIDFSRPISLFAQTTYNEDIFEKLVTILKSQLQKAGFNHEEFHVNKSICKHVSNRKPALKSFCQRNDVIVFVSGENSSNGRSLYNYCRSINPKSYFVSSVETIDPKWFYGAEKIGVSGATSTPAWLLQNAASKIDS